MNSVFMVPEQRPIASLSLCLLTQTPIDALVVLTLSQAAWSSPIPVTVSQRETSPRRGKVGYPSPLLTNTRIQKNPFVLPFTLSMFFVFFHKIQTNPNPSRDRNVSLASLFTYNHNIIIAGHHIQQNIIHNSCH